MIIGIVASTVFSETLLNNLVEADFDQVSLTLRDLQMSNAIALIVLVAMFALRSAGNTNDIRADVASHHANDWEADEDDWMCRARRAPRLGVHARTNLRDRDEETNLHPRIRQGPPRHSDV